jgi:1-acyl-sn-glycerol-3-phosphate acyltransferase
MYAKADYGIAKRIRRQITLMTNKKKYRFKVRGFSIQWMICFPLVIPFVILFYRQFRRVGYNKIASRKPALLAPNHQNAFMDALVLLPFSPFAEQPSYLVRASIFKSKLAARFLHGFNMLPVYRQQDKVNIQERNDEIFENCIYLMENQRRLVIYPEATHNIKRQLLSLKKGISRIAFSAEERNNYTLGINIYPVGIYYTDPRNFFKRILIQIGNPIPVSKYIETYKINPAVAHNQLKKDLEAAIKPLVIDITLDNYYDTIELLREIDNNNKNITDVSLDFKNSKALIAKVEHDFKNNPNKAEEIKQLAYKYKDILDKFNLRDKIFSPAYKIPNVFTIVMLIISLPFFISGYLLNIIPFSIPVFIARRGVIDPGFISSIKVSMGMIFYLLFHNFFAVITAIVFGNRLFGLALWLSMPLLGYIALRWFLVAKKVFYYDRYKKINSKNPDYIQSAIQLRATLSGYIKNL